MQKSKGNAFSLGGNGFVIIILAFISCYLYSALTSDSLNIAIPIFGAMGLNTNALYSMSTVATIFGILASILFGKLMSVKTASKMWALSMVLLGVFALIWSQTNSVAIYAVGYIGCYCLSLVAAQLLGYEVIAYWFPKKRGTAMGILTAGFPLSAATTTAVCSAFVGSSGISSYYITMAVIAIIVGIIIFVFVRDFPEEKGCFPDNNKDFDFEAAKKEHEANLHYLKSSKWTVGKCLTTGRMWVLWVAVGVTGFLSMGIMANFVNKFMESGYTMTQILPMLGIAGVLAIPGSVIIGWIDTRFSTKVAGMLVNIGAALAVLFNLTSITPLHYLSLPILAVMLGGSSNMMVSCTSAIWGRYDFQNAFRVIQPLNSIMTGVGITVVGIIGTNVNYYTAYAFMFVLAIIGTIAMAILKIEPIDSEVK
jgi:MFS transporter, OFA family, oxalate/formate antiporter